MKSFRKKSEKICLFLYSDFGNNEDSEKAFREHPYCWLWLLIPIAGISIFLSYPIVENHARREIALKKRRAELDNRRGSNEKNSMASIPG